MKALYWMERQAEHLNGGPLGEEDDDVDGYAKIIVPCIEAGAKPQPDPKFGYEEAYHRLEKAVKEAYLADGNGNRVWLSAFEAAAFLGETLRQTNAKPEPKPATEHEVHAWRWEDCPNKIEVQERTTIRHVYIGGAKVPVENGPVFEPGTYSVVRHHRRGGENVRVTLE